MQDFGRQVGIAIRWLPLILIGAIAAGAIAYTWSSGQPAVYQATARLLVDPGPEATFSDVALAEGAALRYAELATSGPFVRAVIDKLELDESVRSVSSRIETSISEETLEVIIDARAGDANAARVLALAVGNEVRNRVRSSLITTQVRAADAAIAANRESIRKLQGRLDGLRNKAQKTAEDRAEILALPREISALQRDIQFLQPSSKAFVRNNLEWFERPTSPAAPIEPRPLYWTLLALVAGGMLAAAAAFGLEYLRTHDKIRDEDDLEAATGLLPIGTVTESRRDRRAPAPARLVMLRYPGSAAAEAYRGVLARVGFASGSARTLMVASASDAEAKSAVAANLALAYAEAGRNVILVDADYRAPRQHAFFGLSNDRGLTTVLADADVPLGWVTVATSHPRLGLMPAGPPPAETSDPLGSQQLSALLRRLLHAADMVIFDSPSMAGNLDAAVIATNLSESLLVVMAGDSESETAEAARVLHAADADVVGAILYRQARRSSGRGAPVVPPPAGAGPRAPQSLPRRIPVAVTRAGAAALGAKPGTTAAAPPPGPAGPSAANGRGGPTAAAPPAAAPTAAAPPAGGNGTGPGASSTTGAPYETPYAAPGPSGSVGSKD